VAITIRELEPADQTRWLPLWQGYQEFYGVSLSEAVTEATWRRMLYRSEPIWGLGAFEGAELAGITHYLFHRSTWLTADTCYLQDLYVVPAKRGRGMARALIDAVYREADAAGAGQVYWLTHTTNSTARTLYDTLATNAGFIVYERFV